MSSPQSNQASGEAIHKAQAIPNPGFYKWYVAGVLSVAMALSFMDRFVLALINEPLRASMQLTDTQLGLLQGTGFVMLYCACAIPLGWLADISNRRNLIIFGMTVWSSATVGAAFADSFEVLLVTRVLVGMGEACLLPAGMSILGGYFAREQLARATSVFAAGAHVGQGLVFMVGGTLLAVLTAQEAQGNSLVLAGITFAPWQGIFLAAGLLAIPALILLCTVREPSRTDAAASGWREQTRSLTGGLSYIYRNFGGFGVHFGATSAKSILGYAFATWGMSVLLRVHDIPPATAGLLLGVGAVILGPIGALSGGVVMDRLTARRVSGAPLIVMAFGSIFAAIGVAGLCLFPSQSFVWIAVSVVVLQLASTFSLPANYAGVQLLTPDRYRGVAASINMLIYTLFGLGVGPTCVGILSDLGGGGPRALANAMLATVLVFTAVVVTFAIFGRRAYQSKVV